MEALKPSTRIRFALDELAAGVALKGAPATCKVTAATTGDTYELKQKDGKFVLTVTRAPELLTVEWQVSGAAVQAEVDVVASRYCTPDEVRSYRADEYQLGETSDEDVLAAIAKAEEVIEHEARRFFQPVIRRVTVDRPRCTPRTMGITGDGTASDVRSVIRATGQDGKAVYVGRASDCMFDVSNLPASTFAEVITELGMSPTPIEVNTAVIALAAWYLAPSNRPDNATSESTDTGVLNFIIGGVNGAATSLPEVNALIKRYGLADYVVG